MKNWISVLQVEKIKYNYTVIFYNIYFYYQMTIITRHIEEKNLIL